MENILHDYFLQLLIFLTAKKSFSLSYNLHNCEGPECTHKP